MSIRIVSHAWAGKLPQYARFLQLQVDSLMRCHDQLEGQIKFTLCYCDADLAVSKIVECLKRVGWEKWGWEFLGMELPELGRRCIGRNLAAKKSQEDFVFFTDVDHLFLLECFMNIPTEFDRVNDNGSSTAAMIYPGEIKIHAQHSIGDDVSTNKRLSLQEVLRDDKFIPKLYNRAIGGVQIVRGDFARQYGYLDGTAWIQPSMPAFKDFRDDVAYRRFCEEHGGVKQVNLPGIYRLRHSRTTYQPDRVQT